MKLVTIPWRTADMQMRVRRAGEHHQRTCVAHDRRQTGRFRVERPDDHPVRADWDGRARPIERIGVTVLRRSVDGGDELSCYSAFCRTRYGQCRHI